MEKPEVKKNFGKKNKSMFVSLFRATENKDIEIKEEDVEMEKAEE